MITLLPNYHETIVLPLSAQACVERLQVAAAEEPGIFNGWVKHQRFRLSLRQKRPSNYSPLITGEIETTSNGCILFVDYRLMPSMRMFLVLWTLLLVIGSVAIGFQLRNIGYTLAGILILAFIYAVAWSNFRLHLKPSREMLLSLFTR